MPPDPSFISCAQNREDVVLWRALQDVVGGRYVEVGANHPLIDSVTRAFYDRGWSGVTIEPAPPYVEMLRAERPRDTVVQAAVTTAAGEITLHLVPGTGLSTIVDSVSARHVGRGYELVDVTVPTARLEDIINDAGWAPTEPIHFMIVDVEGAEAQVLSSLDLRTWRPWVLVVESTAPTSTEQTHGAWEPEVLAAGYQFCLFDGLSRFYVADEHADRLKEHLSYPACPLDSFMDRAEAALVEERLDLLAQATHWRTVALTHWADAAAKAANELRGGEAERLLAEIDALKGTLSWRITRPLREVRGLLGRVRGR